MSDLIDKQVVLDTIHLYFTEEIDKIPTKKTEDGEVYVIHKCQPLFEMNKAICKRIKALPSVSLTQNCVGNALDMRCDDAISRQKVLNVINLGWDYRKNCIEAIEKLPPVTQQPKIGHWITGRSTYYDVEVYRCSECKSWSAYKAEKCPNCHVRMVGEKE